MSTLSIPSADSPQGASLEIPSTRTAKGRTPAQAGFLALLDQSLPAIRQRDTVPLPTKQVALRVDHNRAPQAKAPSEDPEPLDIPWLLVPMTPPAKADPAIKGPRQASEQPAIDGAYPRSPVMPPRPPRDGQPAVIAAAPIDAGPAMSGRPAINTVAASAVSAPMAVTAPAPGSAAPSVPAATLAATTPFPTMASAPTDMIAAASITGASASPARASASPTRAAASTATAALSAAPSSATAATPAAHAAPESPTATPPGNTLLATNPSILSSDTPSPARPTPPGYQASLRVVAEPVQPAAEPVRQTTKSAPQTRPEPHGHRSGSPTPEGHGKGPQDTIRPAKAGSGKVADPSGGSATPMIERALAAARSGPTDAVPPAIPSQAAEGSAIDAMRADTASSPIRAGGTQFISLPVPFGSPAWAAHFTHSAVQFMAQAADGSHQVQLQLHPADLGPVHIQLNLQDGTTQLMFFAAHAPVRQALEAALPQLQAQLAEAGVSLGQASVSDHPPGQQQADEHALFGTPRNGLPKESAVQTAQSAEPSTTAQRRSAGRSHALVDTYA